MDTWLLLSNLEANGERTRTLQVLKSRGMPHSNQVREFVFTDKGVDLVDVYVAERPGAHRPDARSAHSASWSRPTAAPLAPARRRSARRGDEEERRRRGRQAGARRSSPSGSCASTSPARPPSRRPRCDNLKRLCETHLAGRYEIEVIDLLVNPKLAAGDQILAVPTLVRKFPEPIRKIIGDLSNEERVLVGLDVKPVPR